jgi:methionine-S-sulfoxide reductase
MKVLTFMFSILLTLNIGAKTMNKEIATLAGGCFWGMEDIIRAIPGVTRTDVGYTGGSVDNPTYEIVKLGTTNHAEAIEVEFDPSKITYSEILGYFFRMHNPTTVNQQGNDKGSQYRSAIFYHSDEQKIKALEAIKKVDASKKWDKPIVTQVLPASKFYKAEEYHQDYLKKNAGGYTCHWLRPE